LRCNAWEIRALKRASDRADVAPGTPFATASTHMSTATSVVAGERERMETLIRQAWKSHGRIPPELKERIVIEHTSLISYIVSRIAVRLPSHVDLEDLHNTGVIGLMDAVDKYEPTKDCKINT
jgi:DNA-directed RNA polymerase sigma subunit (sigma70/sigma32)